MPCMATHLRYWDKHGLVNPQYLSCLRYSLKTYFQNYTYPEYIYIYEKQINSGSILYKLKSYLFAKL